MVVGNQRRLPKRLSRRNKHDAAWHEAMMAQGHRCPDGTFISWEQLHYERYVWMQTEVNLDRFVGVGYYVRSRWPNPEDAPKQT